MAKPKRLLQGNEAFAYAALQAGVNMVAGYPGTPSSEVIETIAKAHAAGVAEGVYVEWSSNEEIALGAIAGAAYAGARTLFTCKMVGMNVASDPLLSLNYVGVKGGTVIYVADDPGPISSQTEQDTRRFGSFAKVPVFDPASLEQGCDMMEVAYELSERYETPVILRPTTRVCHASAFFDVPEHTQARPVDGFERSKRWVIFPTRAYEGHGEINERLVKIRKDFSSDEFARFNPIVDGGGAGAAGGAAGAGAADGAAFANEAPTIGIMAGGISAMYVQEALRQIQDAAAAVGATVPAYRFMQVGTPYPFPEERVADFVAGLERIIVFEELDHWLEDQLLAYCGKTHGSFDVFGKLTGTTLDRGENSTDDCAQRLRTFFGLQDAVTLPQDVPSVAIADSLHIPDRPPVLCPGCPHRGAFYAVKQALGGATAQLCGDIGCYTLGNAMPLDAVDTCLCMGAGISAAQGLAVVQPDAKQVAFVGDSTFFASGLPGVVNAFYNQHDVTIAVLDNSTTAMTGSQPHPGTGQTLMGPKTQPVSIEAILRAIGYTCITKANPFDLDESVAAAKEAIAFEGPSAILFQAPCVKLVKPDTPVVITDECTGCRVCVDSIGCPALSFDEDEGMAKIDESLCTGCNLCVDLCEFGAIEEG